MKSKEQKRAEAVTRDYVYADLSHAEKLAQIEERPGASRRELDRLNKVSA